MADLSGQAGMSAQMGNYARYDVEFVRGDGMQLFDSEGHAHLDLLSGLGVMALGHGDPRVRRAVEAQLAELVHTSNLFWTPPAERLAEQLVAQSFAESVFFCNSGTEANEAAIKLARAKAAADGRPGRDVVVLERAFHGRTYGALSATPQEQKQLPFAPLVPGFRVAPADDAEALRRAVTEQTCAVLIEPVQGEGGVRVISDELLLAAREAADAVGALLIFDEVQCGIGRTGTLFAHQQTPVVPDLMTLAKALGGGLPIGALLASGDCSDVLGPGLHGSTFGGNPVVCAAAEAVLAAVSDPQLLAAVGEQGAALTEVLARHGEVHGRGLMLGVDLPDRDDAPQLVRRLLEEQRVIVNATGPSTLRLLPPLVIGEEEIARCAAALEAVLA